MRAQQFIWIIIVTKLEHFTIIISLDTEIYNFNHTQFAPKNIPFTYLWAPKIDTFLSTKYIGESFLAQPNEYAAVKENRMSKPIRLGEGVQLLRGKIFVIMHSKTF